MQIDVCFLEVEESRAFLQQLGTLQLIVVVIVVLREILSICCLKFFEAEVRKWAQTERKFSFRVRIV